MVYVRFAFPNCYWAILMCLLTPCPPAWPVQALLDCGHPALSPPEDLVHARDAQGNLLLHELLAHCHYGPQFDTDEAGIHFDPLLQVGRLLTPAFL